VRGKAASLHFFGGTEPTTTKNLTGEGSPPYQTSALEAAHREGVIHRDLKPGNLRLMPGGRLKILDFGLAQRVEPADQGIVTQSMSEPSGAAGTLAYMAPEQLRDEKADPRVDLWAAGVVLYELATARRPFEGKTATALADAILHASPAAPQSLMPTLSPRLADIILKCLEKDAENRYQSAKELLVDLRRLGIPTATAALSAPQRQILPKALATAGVVMAARSQLRRPHHRSPRWQCCR
jgi:eukaryotic-like serine/threonine-protein kinase